ncbi:uncharacterized protein LOC115443254 isoform X2 [Manduca sexta]|uniref:uncharacterized protein LOC115443254 isoform X2 n=1 Tax=Manduca sexta TaxID=7130 RepID=UPI00188E858F|nr:uncharacterized protein LOC115443254 isoform X2 [Manduca sexta]
MRKNFPVTTKLIIVLFFVDWYEIALVHSTDILDFWERDPSFDDARRHNDKSGDHEKHTDKQFRYNRGKTQERSPTNAEKRGNRATYRSRDDAGKINEIRGDIEQGRNLRQGRDRAGKWPKVHQYIKQWSTRITPMYLKQQPDKETQQNRGEFPETLSPYFISRHLKSIMDKFPKANVTSETIGRTVEYNDIVILKITETKPSAKRFFRADESKYMDEVPEKKIVFIVHGLSVMGMRMLPCLTREEEFTRLVSYYLDHLDKFDIFLIPLANPDGYVKVAHLMWNKNMSPQSACPGVALDRNFDVAWNATRTISSCSQLYPGPAAFSEAETKAIRDVFHHYSHKIVAYFHVHAGSYTFSTFKGDAVLYPKGYTDSQTDDDKYLDLRGEIDEAMKNASFQILTVTVDTLYNWYGKISGSSVDYASSVYGIPYALELVMQLYNMASYEALTEIWKRVIDVTFNNIWKNTYSNDVK